jgi:hypothetical protein
MSRLLALVTLLPFLVAAPAPFHATERRFSANRLTGTEYLYPRDINNAGVVAGTSSDRLTSTKGRRTIECARLAGLARRWHLLIRQWCGPGSGLIAAAGLASFH